VRALKEIKTKSAIKDIKVLDKATDVSRRAKNAYIRTKEQAEHTQQPNHDSFVGYAGDKVKEGAKAVTREAGHAAERQGKKAVQKIKERRSTGAGANCTGAADGYAGEETSRPETGNPQTGSRNKTSFKENQTFSPRSGEGPEQLNSPMQAKQPAKRNAAQFRTKETVKRKFTLSKQNELAKRRFVQSRSKQRLTEAGEIRPSIQKSAQAQTRQTAGHTTLQPVRPPLFQPAEKAAAQALHPSGEPGRTIRQAAYTGVKNIKEASKGTVKTAQRSVKAGDKAVKEAAKSTVKTAAKSIKTSGYTAKAAVKTSQASAKAAAKTAQTTQRAAQAARLAARAAAVSAKTAAKAMAAAIKAIIAAAKGLTALIAVGGWIAVVVILVICLAGLLLGSAFGIFYSNESPGGNTPVMTEAVSKLNEEFTAEIQRIQDENPHDTLDLSGSDSISTSHWREILAVYAVKVAADPESGMEVATLDDTKVGILRDVFWDMNKIDYWLETIEHEETVITTDGDGNETTETIITTETILHINITSKSYTDMIAEYGFNSDQVKMLNELMKDEYQELFMQLIGS
jgi:hypothetical protein